MNIEKIFKTGIIFLVGFLTAIFTNFYFAYGLENPLSINLGYGGFGSEQAPFDFIQREQIEIHPDRIVIRVDDASISNYAPTGSMKPLLDEGANGIRIVPKSEEEIHIGDIISFRNEAGLIVHRVIDIGTDEKGVYYITKGDNTNIIDGKVRFEEIEFKTIAIIW